MNIKTRNEVTLDIPNISRGTKLPCTCRYPLVEIYTWDEKRGAWLCRCFCKKLWVVRLREDWS